MYPSKQKILAKRPKFRKGTIMILKIWKTTAFKNWKTQEKWTKMEALGLLIEALCALHRKKSPKIKLDVEYAYLPRSKTIYLDANNPSIISVLHELAHHLYGNSELKACRWSIWLFKEVFPGLYKNLKWEGHMLKK